MSHEDALDILERMGGVHFDVGKHSGKPFAYVYIHDPHYAAILSTRPGRLQAIFQLYVAYAYLRSGKTLDGGFWA